MAAFLARGWHMVRVLIAAAAVLTTAELVFANDVPRLTVATKRFGGVQLMTIGIDGSNPTQLTDEPDDASQPTWCPDGTKLAYISGPRMNGKLKIMDADGKNAHVVFEGEGSQRTPMWSPDGKQIAFSMEVGRNFNYEIFVINVDGAGLKNVSNSPLFDADPAWSPDGKKIAFARAIIGGGHFPRVFIMNADGSEQVDVLDREQNSAVYPSWTHDSKQITYGGPDANGKIQVMQCNADGNASTVLTSGERANSYASWSADGQYLAYTSEPGGQVADLCIYDVVAGEHRTVLKAEVFQELFRDARPAWEPLKKK
jgi:Tol biopolymer transport system component